jgi:hypothetical protein
MNSVQKEKKGYNLCDNNLVYQAMIDLALIVSGLRMKQHE